mgnify:CR=1 FL=1
MTTHFPRQLRAGAAFSCAGTCDKGQTRPAGKRKCARSDGVNIVTDLRACPEGFKENLGNGRCDKVAEAPAVVPVSEPAAKGAPDVAPPGAFPEHR